MRTYITKAQRLSLVDRYMGNYEQWFLNEPDVYDAPAKRRAELATLNNSQLVAEVEDYI